MNKFLITAACCAILVGPTSQPHAEESLGSTKIDARANQLRNEVRIISQLQNAERQEKFSELTSSYLRPNDPMNDYLALMILAGFSCHRGANELIWEKGELLPIVCALRIIPETSLLDDIQRLFGGFFRDDIAFFSVIAYIGPDFITQRYEVIADNGSVYP